MTDHSKRIFGNPVSAAAYDKAKRSKSPISTSLAMILMPTTN